VVGVDHFLGRHAQLVRLHGDRGPVGVRSGEPQDK
jgi:hypothetical protein